MKVKPLLQCHILLGRLAPEVVSVAPRMPMLETLLARAGEIVQTEGGAEAWLCQSFGLQQQDGWPVAPFSALGDGLVPGDDYWLRADPVHLHLLRDRMVVGDTLQEGVSETFSCEAAQAMVAMLNQYFSGNGLQFFAPRHNRWYLKLKHRPNMSTHALPDVIGQDANLFLPYGVDAMQWHACINEVQMLLHDHPVNAEREQRGEPLINSVWLWGGGVLQQPVVRPFEKVWAENPLVHGLMELSGEGAQAMPVSVEQWMLSQPVEGNHLFMLEHMNTAVSQDQAETIFNRLEQFWFVPVLRALQHGQITKLYLHLAEKNRVKSFSLSRNDLRKFWRRAKPLKVFLDG